MFGFLSYFKVVCIYYVCKIYLQIFIVYILNLFIGYILNLFQTKVVFIRIYNKEVYMIFYATGILIKKGRGGGVVIGEDFSMEGEEEGERIVVVQESDEEEKSDVELDFMIKVYFFDKCRMF